jgi:SecD/SecF fusion protein
MRIVMTLMVVVTLTGCATMPREEASVSVEFRPAAQSPGPGLTEMMATESAQPVYVSGNVLLSNDSVKSARMVSSPYGPQIEIVFTKAGTEAFARATEQNLMKPIAILVEGKLISAPIVREKITAGRAVITGKFTEQEAKRIAAGIVGK